MAGCVYVCANPAAKSDSVFFNLCPQNNVLHNSLIFPSKRMLKEAKRGCNCLKYSSDGGVAVSQALTCLCDLVKAHDTKYTTSYAPRCSPSNIFATIDSCLQCLLVTLRSPYMLLDGFQAIKVSTTRCATEDAVASVSQKGSRLQHHP